MIETNYTAIDEKAPLPRITHKGGLRILILCDSTYLAEDVMYTLFLAGGLARGGMNPYVLHNPGMIGPMLERRGLPAKELKKLSWGPLHPIRYRAVVHEVREFKPQIIHAIGGKMTYTGAWLAASLRVPCMVSLLRKPRGRTSWAPPAKVARLILPSQAMRTSLVNQMKVPSGLCSVVYPGVDVDEIAEPDEPMVGGYPSIAMAGLLGLDRGYRRFIHLAAGLMQEGHEAEFLILGEGPRFRELRHAVAVKNLTHRMTFIQWPIEWQEVLRLCALSVCIEPEIGGEMPILLSMASGCPVVAASTGTAFDFLNEGETGLLVDAGDETGFLSAMASLISHPMRAYEMGLAARETVRKRYPIHNMVNAIREIYESAIQVIRAG